jgi:dihydrodipicolinate synthase/N-acetylneuraminate lyase
VAALMYGAKGAIPASCNIAPEWCVGMYEAFVRGDLAAAQAMQARLHPVRLAMSLGTGNGAIKEGMAVLGRGAGPSRSPVSPLSADKRVKLKEILEKAGVRE